MKCSFKVPIKIAGAKLKDKSKLMESQSGGAFTAIAEWFLEQGAVVYGCGMDTDLNVIYKRITCIEDLHLIKGSKYVQAQLGNTFQCVKDDLNSGKVVLFSGTPCYVHAVQRFTDSNINRENLYTIDLICHGVPSPLIYKTYLRELERKKKGRIRLFIFRDKRGGWNRHMERVIYDDGSEEVLEDYTKIFYTNLPLRPCCGKCPFAKVERASDFTVGDFWGVQNVYPEFYDDRGVSIIFLNSGRSVRIFDKISDKLEVLETDIHHGMQPNLKKSSKIPGIRSCFWADFRRRGILYCAEKWPPIIEFPLVLKADIRKIIHGFRQQVEILKRRCR